MDLIRKRGSTSNIERYQLKDATATATDGGFTGLAYNTSGLSISVVNSTSGTVTVYTGANLQDITTLGTYAAPSSGKCRIKKVDDTNFPGLVEVQFEDSVYATGKHIEVLISGVTNLLPCRAKHPLWDFDPYDVIRAGLTALPAVAAGSLGGLALSGEARRGFYGKYPDLPTLPTSEVLCCAFSPSGRLFATANDVTPFVDLYLFDDRTGAVSKFSNPGTLPSGQCVCVAFSPDGKYLAITSNSTPYFYVYPVSETSGWGTVLSNPATVPAGTPGSYVNSLAWSPDSAYLATTNGSGTGTLTSVYHVSSGTLTKISDPSSALSGTPTGVCWSPDGKMIAYAITGSPYVEAYAFSAGAFGSKFSNPSQLPASNLYGITFSPDSKFFVAVTTTILEAWNVNTTTGWGAYVNPPAEQIKSGGNAMGVAFHPSGTMLAVADDTPDQLKLYEWIPGHGFGCLYAKPATSMTGEGWGIAWHPGGTIVACSLLTTPFMGMYAVNDGSPPKFPNSGDAYAAASTGSAPTAAQVASAVWQDTTSGDFTVSGSVGKSLLNGGTLGNALTIAHVTLTDTVTTYTGNTPQTGDSYAVVTDGTHGLAALLTAINAVAAACATAVWAAASRTLTAFGFTVDTNANSTETAIKSEVDAIYNKLPSKDYLTGSDDAAGLVDLYSMAGTPQASGVNFQTMANDVTSITSDVGTIMSDLYTIQNTSLPAIKTDTGSILAIAQTKRYDVFVKRVVTADSKDQYSATWFEDGVVIDPSRLTDVAIYAALNSDGSSIFDNMPMTQQGDFPFVYLHGTTSGGGSAIECDVVATLDGTTSIEDVFTVGDNAAV